MASSSGRSMSSMAQEFGVCIPYDLGIMIIDEDITCLKLLQTLLSTCHYRVISFTDANEALQNLWEKKSDFDLVMAEYRMTTMGGLELLERIVLGVNVPVISKN
ncbi:hypothetical protein HPP92_003065 [Vanilla planifolia]|uniref:Response regulatory domain-containing protein n=1 Tax=Vanilla planifolia TaxID=51239 RepID=A0A835RZA4_VANPL|nr:hypothetical protein HPP92_003065 [Vanilla planifolia]